MGIFSASRKIVEEQDNVTDVDFSEKTKKEHGITISNGIQDELQALVNKNYRGEKKYQTVEEFGKDISNEDLLLLIEYKISKMSGKATSMKECDGEIDKYEISNEEKEKIKNNIKKGICEPTKSIQYDTIEEADIRVTSIDSLAERDRKRKENIHKYLTEQEQEARKIDKPEMMICSRMDFKEKNNSIMVSIPIEKDAVDRYNEMVDFGELEELKKVSYNTFIESGKSQSDAEILSKTRAKSMLVSRSLEISAAKGKVWISDSSKESYRTSFLNMYDIRDKDVQCRTAESELCKTKEKQEQQNLKEEMM